MNVIDNRQTDDRQTTDGRTTTNSEREHEFTFAKDSVTGLIPAIYVENIRTPL